MPDDDFAPELGRKRGKDGKRTVKYGGRILKAARLAGPKTGGQSRRFDGRRIGRRARMGRPPPNRSPLAGFRGRQLGRPTAWESGGASGLIRVGGVVTKTKRTPI